MTKPEREIVEFANGMLKMASRLRDDAIASSSPTVSAHQNGGAVWLELKARHLLEGIAHGRFAE